MMNIKKVLGSMLIMIWLPIAAYAQEAEKGPVDFAAMPCEPHLFKISKSDNKNVLFYDGMVKDGRFDLKNPVDIYWIMYAEKDQREGLTLLERPQFGIHTKTVAAGESYIINVKNDVLAKRDISVFLDVNKCPRAITVLNGREALLNHIFIQIKPGSGLIPTVQYLDIMGTAMDDQEAVTERVFPK